MLYTFENHCCVCHLATQHAAPKQLRALAPTHLSNQDADCHSLAREYKGKWSDHCFMLVQALCVSKQLVARCNSNPALFRVQPLSFHPHPLEPAGRKEGQG